MKYFIDTEFIEYPCTIDLISIGIVSEDGKQLYCVSSEFDESKASDWVRENVLPKVRNATKMLRFEIADAIKAFIGDDNKPEFWGYYADYDWVVFCWLFGSMIDLPRGWPMFCRDLKQLLVDKNDPIIPESIKPNRSQLHGALEDAWYHKRIYDWLDTSQTRRYKVSK